MEQIYIFCTNYGLDVILNGKKEAMRGFFMLDLMNMELKHYYLRDCSFGWHLDEHVYQRNALALIIQGDILYTINQKEYHATQGNLVYMPSGSIRKATPSKDCVFVAMDFNLKKGQFRLPTVSKVSLTERVNSLLKSIEYHWLQMNERDRIKAHILFLDLIHELLFNKVENHSNRHVDRIKRYVTENFSVSITVEELANYVELSPAYCGTLFKKEEGRTILDYVNNIRINHAATLLTEGGYSMSQIADMCGFKDVYYFSKTFKKQMGLSPKKYWAENNYD